MSVIEPIRDYSSSKYITTDDGSVYEKVGWGRTAGAVVAGNAVGSLCALYKIFFASPY